MIPLLYSEDECFLVAPDMQPAKDFLSEAIRLKLRGNRSQYDKTVSEMTKREHPEMLWRIYLALSDSASIITKR